MSIPAINTPLFAKRPNISVYTEPNTKSNRLQFATDAKNEFREWKTGDSIGYTTGIIQSTNEGTFIEVVTRQWIRQKLSNNTPKGLFFVPGINVIAAAVTNTVSEWIRVETKAYVIEGDYYTNDERLPNERLSIEKKVAEYAGALPKEYQPVSIFQNEDGVWSVKLPNGYVTSVENYGKGSLLERKNLAISISNQQSGIVGNPNTTPKPEPEADSLPSWAIALLIALGVSGLGFLGYSIISKPSKNGRFNKR